MPETNRPALPPRWIKDTEWEPVSHQPDPDQDARDRRREALKELVVISENLGLYDL